MTASTIKAQLERLRNARKAATSSPEAAIAFLERAGLAANSGKHHIHKKTNAQAISVKKRAVSVKSNSENK